ncbi:hypothetical protein M2323_001490 [Rhodoblastus acidophilus]|nr:hypothetical protein [Rhodoblastus acidophilus]MCW2332577.1 hypothetical protein [Rhodoblastus acidophilus]
MSPALSAVMAGLVPAIHAGMEGGARTIGDGAPVHSAMWKQRPGVDARDEPGHDVRVVNGAPGKK